MGNGWVDGCGGIACSSDETDKGDSRETRQQACAQACRASANCVAEEQIKQKRTFFQPRRDTQRQTQSVHLVDSTMTEPPVSTL